MKLTLEFRCPGRIVILQVPIVPDSLMNILKAIGLLVHSPGAVCRFLDESGVEVS